MDLKIKTLSAVGIVASVMALSGCTIDSKPQRSSGTDIGLRSSEGQLSGRVSLDETRKPGVLEFREIVQIGYSVSNPGGCDTKKGVAEFDVEHHLGLIHVRIEDSKISLFSDNGTNANLKGAFWSQSGITVDARGSGYINRDSAMAPVAMSGLFSCS